MLLFYVRHGDPIYDPDSLTPLGERQAQAISKRLGVHGLDQIYASSSNRAILTAKPTGELLKKEITVMDWCHEGKAFDEFSIPLQDGTRTWFFCHQPTTELLVSEEVRVLGKRWYEHPALKQDLYKECSFKEGILRIQKETDAFIQSLGYRHLPEKNGYLAEAPSDARIALFAHEGVGKAIMSCLLDIPYPEFCTHFEISHSGMCVVEFANREGFVIPKVLQYSNDSHLYEEGLPLKYQNWIYI